MSVSGFSPSVLLKDCLRTVEDLQILHKILFITIAVHKVTARYKCLNSIQMVYDTAT